MAELAVDRAARKALRRDAKLVGLVSGAHGMSHFYNLALPPIFPLLTAEFGIGYADLGFVTSVMYVVAGVLQTPAGMLVDRLGPAPMLSGGLALCAGAVLLFGIAPGFWWLLPLAIMAGLGDCVFHPADYAILNARIGAGRLGRAYSAHSIAGNIGWVAAPLSVLGLAALFGWRWALAMVGGAGLLFALYLTMRRELLSDGTPISGALAAGTVQPAGKAAPQAVLLYLPVLSCFAYFALLSVALAGLETFLPSALIAAFGLSIATANGLLTGFLLAASLGVIAGGILADRLARHELVIAAGLAAAALPTLLMAAAALPAILLPLCVGLAGLAVGATGPARDLLVRGATPAGATGKVYGFVYSGLNLGSVLATPFFGWLIDRQQSRLVFVASALALVCAIGTAAVVGKRGAQPA